MTHGGVLGGNCVSGWTQPERIDMDPNNELLVIQQTDVDAKTAKRSAAALGYLDDPFISLFVRSGDRKPPIINRGRVTLML
jgi:hypothetical protein